MGLFFEQIRQLLLVEDLDLEQPILDEDPSPIRPALWVYEENPQINWSLHFYVVFHGLEECERLSLFYQESGFKESIGNCLFDLCLLQKICNSFVVVDGVFELWIVVEVHSSEVHEISLREVR